MDLHGKELIESAGQIAWSGGSATWNAFMKVIQVILTKTPQEVFPDVWAVTVESILPWFIGAGAALINLFFFIGFIRQNTNLKENVTLEVWIESGIRVVVANTLIICGVDIMEDFLTLSTVATRYVVGPNILEIVNPEFDASTIFFYLCVGLLYFITSVVCSMMILLTICIRILYICFCVVAMPIGIATFAGGRGLENSGIAWLKTFLTFCFQIVVIAFLLRIGTIMASGLSPLLQDGFNGLEIMDGFLNGVNNLFIMVFMTSAIKNSDDLIKRTFDLR